ncbi:hypothetical protein [Pedobacter helvus]|uniref:Uncharacterized protein n=1 Tax=Pedobacter helvus TaxID=2563444 RepID=A0ABW9JMX6_9SPHI|nr:hypothetical protein [Pedobacter ureilyticus]
MKRSILYLIIIAVVTITIFFKFAFDEEKKGFNRILISKKLHIEERVQLPNSKFYFVGSSGSWIFLKTLYDVKHIYYIDINSSHLKSIDLKLKTGFQNYHPKLNVSVQDSLIFILNYGNKNLIVNNIVNHKQFITDMPTNVFDQPAILFSNSIISRETVNTDKLTQRAISKFDYIKKVPKAKYILDKQVDGYFCNDGMLKWDAKNERLFYMYFYRGYLLCLDTNLNLTYKLKTIDTITRSNITLTKKKQVVNGDTIITQTQKRPPIYVNKRFFTDKEHVYIISAVKADNEKQSDFRKNQIVDVYEIKKGSYKYSFYIPDYRSEKLRQITEYRNEIYAIYGSYFVKISSLK